MLKRYLLTPGPTMVPEQVLLDMAKPIMHHRTPEFAALFDEARQGLKVVFKTEEEPLILASSGTGAMEAAIANTLSAGDKALVINGGKFGERWIKICQAYDVTPITLDIEWGLSANADQVADILKKDPSIKAVCMQGSETSTTVYHPVKDIAAVTKDLANTILIVDGITSVGVHDTRFDEWGIDILLTGSQKALMLPPGLAFITLSKKAWAMAESSKSHKFYFNLKTELKNQLKKTTAWTAGVSLVVGLNTVISMIKSEGLENVFNRHAINAEATRQACLALGMKLLAKGTPSNAATGAFLPEGIDGKQFVKYMRDKCGVSLAGGQDQLEGKVVRISHLGYHDLFDTITAISAIEMGLKKFGADIKLGHGVAAAEQVLSQEFPSI